MSNPGLGEAFEMLLTVVWALGAAVWVVALAKVFEWWRKRR